MSRLQPSDGGAGVPTCRRSQIEVSEEGAGVASCRRSQIEVREEGTGVIIPRGTSPAAPAPPLEDENLLLEILLCLPSQPSSLHRASAVCKQWRCTATDPRFHRLFCQRHRKPPLLGIFEQLGEDEYVFTPVLDPPDRIPPESTLGRYSSCYGSEVVGCRHGLVLIRDYMHREFIVLDPIISESRHVAFPPELEGNYVNGAVLCTAGDADKGHVHGACHSCPFKLVLVLANTSGYMASVYSSESGVWSDFISIEAPPHTRDPIGNCPSTLVGNVLYWRARHNGLDILAFDLDTHNLTVIKAPQSLKFYSEFQIIKASDGAVGLAALEFGPYGSNRGTWQIQMWQRKIDCHGDATWLLHKTIETHTILGLSPESDGRYIVAYDEDNGVLFLQVDYDVYMVELVSMQSRKSNLSILARNHHPFTSFYAPVIHVRRNGAEMLHDT